MSGLRAKTNVLHARADTVLLHLHLLWISWHVLWLRPICVWLHGPRRGMHRLIGVRELHVLCFEVRGPLTVVRLPLCSTGRVVWTLTLLSL